MEVYDKYMPTFSGPHVNAHKHNVNNELKMLERFGYVYWEHYNIIFHSFKFFQIAMSYWYIVFHAAEGTS